MADVKADPSWTEMNERLDALVAHLPGKHNQKAHGSGSTGIGEWKDGKLVAGRAAGDPLTGEAAFGAVGGASLTEDELSGVRAYVGIGSRSGFTSREVNANLRSGERAKLAGERDGAPEWKRKAIDRELGQMDEATSVLDGAIAKGRVGEDITVYRGVSRIDDALGGAGVGSVISDAGYMSTSANPAVAAGKSGSGGVLRVKVPKGAHALALGDDVSSGYGYEQEILLPRGSRMRITADGMEDGVRTVDVELA